jgi:hypothetical protein
MCCAVLPRAGLGGGDDEMLLTASVDAAAVEIQQQHQTGSAAAQALLPQSSDDALLTAPTPQQQQDVSACLPGSAPDAAVVVGYAKCLEDSRHHAAAKLAALYAGGAALVGQAGVEGGLLSEDGRRASCSSANTLARAAATAAQGRDVALHSTVFWGSGKNSWLSKVASPPALARLPHQHWQHTELFVMHESLNYFPCSSSNAKIQHWPLFVYRK